MPGSTPHRLVIEWVGGPVQAAAERTRPSGQRALALADATRVPPSGLTFRSFAD